MSNLWEFLLQTLSVSCTAALLILCKTFFAKTLPPRWQYGIWGILVLRILLPVRVTQTFPIPLPLWIETIKTIAEAPLFSAYTTPWEPLSLRHVLPIYPTTPQSITDWLFCIYGIGVVLSLLLYAASYLRLRYMLHRHGKPLSPELQALRHTVITEHHLPERLAHRSAFILPGIHSPFVCGETLVLPKEGCDRLVLLHELLHLQYHDGLQSLGWCVLRCLHWCDPVLWFVFRRIESDMEMLCDCRVLEKCTDTAERRSYGEVLLTMATEHPSRPMPGTSRMACSKKVVTQRIQSIVHHTKYPAETGVVACCIALLLAIPTLAGLSPTYDDTDFTPDTTWQLQRSLAMTRLHRCSTVAGALDTWAKGMYTQNGIALSTVSPLSMQEEYARLLYNNIVENEKNKYHVRTPLYTLPTEYAFLPGQTYQLFHLTETEDGCYTAMIAFAIQLPDDVGETAIGLPGKGSLCIPVRVEYDGTGWVVVENDERIVSGCDFDQLPYPGSPIEPLRSYVATGTYGTVEVSEHVTYQVATAEESGLDPFFVQTNPNTDYTLDGRFRYAVVHPHVTYTPVDEAADAVRYGFRITTLYEADDLATLPNRAYPSALDSIEDTIEKLRSGKYNSSSGGSNDGSGWAIQNVVRGKELSPIYWGSGDYHYEVDAPVPLPYGYAVQIIWNTDIVETYLCIGDTVEVSVPSANPIIQPEEGTR